MSERAGPSFGRGRVTCGLPSRAARLGTTRTRVGECWNTAASGDATAEVLISPVIDDPREVAAVLVHERLHVALPGFGHGKPFQKAAKALGLARPFTSAVATDTFLGWMEPLLAASPPTLTRDCLRCASKARRRSSRPAT